MSLSVLPDELIEIIGSLVEADDLLNLCTITPQLADRCKNLQFWRNLILYFHSPMINLENLSLNELIVLYQKIRQSGYLYILGGNKYGALGLGHVTWVTQPTKVFARNDILQISCRYMHSALVTAQGQVYIFGNNDHCQLGLGDTDSRNIPTPIPDFSNVIQVSCGNFFTAFITDNGQLYTFGHNHYGQLGASYDQDVSRPSLVDRLIDKKIVQVSCGSIHMGVVTSEGQAYVWGSGTGGRLGQGPHNLANTSKPALLDINQKIKQLVCGSDITALLTDNGDVYMCGVAPSGQLGIEGTDRLLWPQRIPNLPPIQQVSLGVFCSLFLTTTGEVYGCGDNSYHQLGVSVNAVYNPVKINNLPPIKRVVTGSSHSVFLTTQGEVYVCGNNSQGRLGLNTHQNTISLPRQIPQLSKVRQISAGFDYTAFII